MENIDNEIEKLTNEDLEKKLIEFNNNQLIKIKEASLLNAMYSIGTSKRVLKNGDEIKVENFEIERDEMLGYLDELARLVKDLDLDRVLDIRNKAFIKKNILDGYLIELSYIAMEVDELGGDLLSESDEFQHFHKEDVDGLINKINATLDRSQDDYNKYLLIIGEIVKILPMRLIKRNYYDMLTNAIKRNFRGRSQVFVDHQVDVYKKQFNSSTRNGYGTEFDYYFMEIQKLKREDLSLRTLEDLPELALKVRVLREELAELLALIQAIGVISNMLIVRSRLDEILVEEKEIVENWEKLYNDWKEDKIIDLNKSIETRLKEIEKSIQEDVAYYEELTRTINERQDFNQETLDGELKKTRDVLVYYNDMMFSNTELLDGFDEEPADEVYIENAVASLYDYMDRSMSSMKNAERKFRMRNLMSKIELPFKDISEFNAYIGYALDSRVAEVGMINFKINQINYFLNEIMDQ